MVEKGDVCFGRQVGRCEESGSLACRHVVLTGRKKSAWEDTHL